PAVRADPDDAAVGGAGGGLHQGAVPGGGEGQLRSVRRVRGAGVGAVAGRGAAGVHRVAQVLQRAVRGGAAAAAGGGAARGGGGALRARAGVRRGDDVHGAGLPGEGRGGGVRVRGGGGPGGVAAEPGAGRDGGTG